MSLSDTWFVYTDASFEMEDGKGFAGFGGTLAGPKQKPVRYFSFELTGREVDKLNPTGRKTIIYECEFSEVSVAFDAGAETLPGKQVVFFIDNNAVRDLLVGCKSNGKVASHFLERIRQGESDASLISWFARFPSKSNIADDHTVLDKLKCIRDVVDKKRKLEWIDGSINGGAEESTIPNLSSKKLGVLGPSGRKGAKSKRCLHSGLCELGKNCV